ncbi:MlaD family protein [Nocardia sp. NPDC058379]|uniref:MlaD family protein n=1 Tax=unclassified Nocardia TaxID=2637762 RepID=UPI00364DBAF7
MVNRILGSRGLLSFSLVALVAVLCVVGFRLIQQEPPARAYCALMPDAIGLFEGSAVTIRGLPVGEVTGVAPAGAQARVEFTVYENYTVAADAGAATLSDTLIADRRLAIVGAESGVPSRASSDCITKTVTPKSITETFAAISRLADELNGAGDPAHPDLVKDGLRALSAASAGTGDQINAIIRGLGSAFASPDEAVGHLGGLIDALAALSRSAASGWSDVESMVTRMAEAIHLINQVIVPPVIEIVDKAGDLLPAIDDITRLAGPGLRRLDSIENLPQLIAAGIGSFQEILDMLPIFTSAFERAVDPATGRIGLSYSPPRVQLSEPVAAQVCAGLGMLVPGTCGGGADGLAQLDLTRLVLASVVTR